jgi:hypothetical protein
MTKRHLRFKLPLTGLQILGEVRSSFMVNHLWHIMLHFSTESQWTLCLQPFILIKLWMSDGEKYFMCYMWMSCLTTLKYSSANFCIEINYCVYAIINLYHCNKQFQFHTFTAHFRCRLQKRYPGMDRIITNTNNRCRTLFKCQMESGDRGKYNLIRESTILSGEVQSYHYASEFCYIYGKFWTTLNSSLLLSAGNTSIFMPCILEEEHFLTQQVTPRQYCHWWSSLLWCDTVSLGEHFLTFCRNSGLPSFFFKTFRKHSPNNKASHPRRFQSSAKPLWEPQISQ